jgi:hypothetical protein
VYQRSSNHQNLTTKSTTSVAEADELFANPRKKPDYVSGAEIIKREAEYWENRIQEQRLARLNRDAANPPSQRKQRRSNPASENAKPPTPATTT